MKVNVPILIRYAIGIDETKLFSSCFTLLEGKSYQKKRDPLKADPVYILAGESLLHSLHIHCIQSFFPLRNFKLYEVVLTDFVNQPAVMNEHFCVCVVSDNEAEALRLIKEFYFSCFH